MLKFHVDIFKYEICTNPVKRKRVKLAKNDLVEEALCELIIEAQKLAGLMLFRKNNLLTTLVGFFPEFQANNGWLNRF
jgi:hypothetical protein